ncbi:MAG: LysR family substrate-binding domain-containing protein [Clostridiaceae bacterium]|nr:LysR family substrate-binding domain-containing protein [Clostridiaceae bacterium]
MEGSNVFTETISVVMHCDHPLANTNSIDLAELANENFIALNRKESPQGFHQTLMICADKGFSPNIVSEPRLLHTVLLLVDSGMGIAILPKSLQLHSSPSLRFIDIEGKKVEHALVVAWKKSNINPSIPLFLQEIESLKSQHEDVSKIIT